MHRLGRNARRERRERGREIVQLTLPRLQAGKRGREGAGVHLVGAALVNTAVVVPRSATNGGG